MSDPQARPDQPLIIQYTNLLHRHRDPNAEPVLEFRQQHANDKTFQSRAEVLDKLFALKKSL